MQPVPLRISLALSLLLPGAVAATMKLADLDQGAEITKCIKITDYNTKTLSEDVEVADRQGNGCCPTDYTYGVKAYRGTATAYGKGMVVCGYQSDGTVGSITTGTNCNYGKCYVIKQDLTCADNTKMKINGCCPSGQWPSSCVKSSSGSSNSMQYCTSYKKVGSSWQTVGTTDETDDVSGGKLTVDKVRSYGFCGVGGSGSSSTTGTVSGAENSAVLGGLALLTAAALSWLQSFL